VFYDAGRCERTFMPRLGLMDRRQIRHSARKKKKKKGKGKTRRRKKDSEREGGKNESISPASSAACYTRTTPRAFVSFRSRARALSLVTPPDRCAEYRTRARVSRILRVLFGPPETDIFFHVLREQVARVLFAAARYARVIESSRRRRSGAIVGNVKSCAKGRDGREGARQPSPGERERRERVPDFENKNTSPSSSFSAFSGAQTRTENSNDFRYSHRPPRSFIGPLLIWVGLFLGFFLAANQTDLASYRIVHTSPPPPPSRRIYLYT